MRRHPQALIIEERPLAALGDDPDMVVGDNEPYSGRHPHDFTIDFHAEPHGLPHIGLEVRQDLVADRAGARRWAAILAGALRGVLQDESLYCRLPDGAESPLVLTPR